jgi:chromosomal replication initiator protein
MQQQYSFDDREETIRLRGAWDQVLLRLKDEIPEPHFTKHIETIRPVSLDEGVATLATAGVFSLEYVRDRCGEKIREALIDELGETIRVRFQSEAREKPRTPARSDFVTHAPSREVVPLRLDPEFRFETFVVGESNRWAYTGALKVAQNPGETSPIFIYGPSGYGKTHLMQAIAHEVLKRDPVYPLRYVSAQAFAEEFIAAVRVKRVDAMRKYYRPVKLWLLDDIQFLLGKEKTQEEIFHTFNSIHSNGGQIAVCSDKSPSELGRSMDDRLLSRLGSGFLADIQRPDTETRCAILMNEADRIGAIISPEIALFLAQNVHGSIRELKGALVTLRHQADAERTVIDLARAEAMVESLYRRRGPVRASISQVQTIVSRHFNIPVDEILGASRKAPIVRARHVAMYLAREITGDSWKHIGDRFGGRDHTSVMHANQKVKELIASDRCFEFEIQRLRAALRPEE